MAKQQHNVCHSSSSPNVGSVAIAAPQQQVTNSNKERTAQKMEV